MTIPVANIGQSLGAFIMYLLVLIIFRTLLPLKINKIAIYNFPNRV